MGISMYTGADSIIKGWRALCPTPFYSVWRGKHILFSNNEDDMDKAESILNDNLSIYEDAGVYDELIIKVHPKKEKLFITDKTEAINTMFVRACNKDMTNNNSTMVGGYNSAIAQGLADIKQLFIQQESRLKTLEEQISNEQLEDNGNLDELGNIERIGDTVSKIMDNPLVNKLIAKILKMDTPIEPLKQIAGIEDDTPDDQFNMAISVLMSADKKFKQHMVKLAVLAQQKPMKFMAAIEEIEQLKI